MRIAPSPVANGHGVEEHPEGALVRLPVVPRAKRTRVVGRHGEAIRIKVGAPPVEDAANAELRCFLARRCVLRIADVVVVRGGHGRDKTVLLRGCTPRRAAEGLLGEGRSGDRRRSPSP